MLEVDSTEEGTVVRVLELGSRRPIEARVTFLCPAGRRPQEQLTVAAGEAVYVKRVPTIVVAETEDHESRWALLADRGMEYSLSLRRLSSVTLVVQQDQVGVGVPGVRVAVTVENEEPRDDQLLAALEGLLVGPRSKEAAGLAEHWLAKLSETKTLGGAPWTGSMRAVTKADGSTVVEALPVGLQLRWEITDPSWSVVRIEPRGIPAGASSGRRSGQFVLDPGAKTVLTAEVRRNTRVEGRVEWGGRRFSVGYVLIRHVHEGEQLRLVTEMTSAIGDDGSFFFDGPAPGRKALSGVVIDDEQRCYFLRRTFDLADGEHKNLGTLFARTSAPVVVQPRFVSPWGQPIRTEHVALPTTAIEMMVASGANVPMESDVTEAIKGNLMRPFILYGLHAGNYLIEVRRGGRLQDGWSCDFSMAHVAFSAPEDETVFLDVVAWRPVRVEFELAGVVPRIARRIECFAVAHESAFWECSFARDAKSEKLVATRGLPEGRLRVFGRVECLDGKWLCFNRAVDVREGMPKQVLDCHAGSTVRGRVLAERRQYSIRMRPLFLSGPLAWIYRSRIRANGEFSIGGVIANQELIVDGFPVRLRSGPPGSEVAVEIK